jgi:hypothetical protein
VSRRSSCTRISAHGAAANSRARNCASKDHNHDNNPPDGSNWELLCLYCHDNEHQEYLDEETFGKAGPSGSKGPIATYRPFEALADLLRKKKT